MVTKLVLNCLRMADADHLRPEADQDRDEGGLLSFCSPNIAPVFWRPSRVGVPSAWWSHVPFGQWLVAATRPRTIVELGTHHGVSYSAFCEAVVRHQLDTKCSAVDTWQGDVQAGLYDESVLAELREFHDARYGAFSDLIQTTLDAAREYFADGTIDLLHIDALHSYEAVTHDFTTWLPKLSDRGIVLFHDVSERQDGFGVWRFWEEQCRRYPHFLFIHGHGLGLFVVGAAAPVVIQTLCAMTDPHQINAIRERFALVGERWALEYRDKVRVAEVGRLSNELANQNAQLAVALSELGVLRPHLEDVERARGTLHDALQEQIARADALERRARDAVQQQIAQVAASAGPVISMRFNDNGTHMPVAESKPRADLVSNAGVEPDASERSGDPIPSQYLSKDCAKLRRVCLFSFYDEQGIVDDYVVFFLRELGKFVERIIFYSNGPLARESEIALKGCVDEVILRPNEGYDVSAYKEGLAKIDFDVDGVYDEVLMVNHTCYGPIFPFLELFAEMDRRACDFWGITAHMAMTPNPMTGTGTLPYHLNANFIAVRREMLRSKTFRQYWDRIKPSTGYEAAILSHEAVFTEYFTKLGYKAESYLASAKYGTHYPAILDIDETLIDRSPIIKRRAFFHDPRFLECYAADLPRALRVLKATSDYDQSLIWRNITRGAELRTLNTNAALTSVLPDVRLKQNAPLPDCGRLAVCVHVYYTDMMEEILALTDTILVPFDFIATTETAGKKAIIEQAATGRGHIVNVIVRVVEQNRGRDMAALFISCRDLFLDGPYELVCRLHTKKTPQVAAGRGNLFKRHMFENLLNSPGFTANVLDMFQDNPWIGVAVPPVVQIAYWTLGHAWYTNRNKAEEVRELLGLKVRFDPDTPIAAYGTMFWFRPKALRKLFAYPWKWADFNAEPNHKDGGLAHVLERLICYVAQDANYTTQQILSSHLAGRNYAMLEYKLQKLSAALPNSDFSYQCHILEEWKRAGYPATIEMQPSSVRRALAEVVGAAKKSVAHRSPTMFKVLQPIYRVLIRAGRLKRS
jgi:lipopolysaccharide biosynthesis protein